MTMQHKITGKKIKYRPMIEADLSAAERDRLYCRAERVTRIARLTAAILSAASMKMIERKPEMAKWYCLRVEPGREFAVEKLLADANVQVFLPREKYVKIHKGQRLVLERADFPTYILVRLVPSHEAFQGLTNLKHVIEIVGNDSGYHIVRDEDVERFMAIATQPNIPDVKTDKSIKEGDRVEVTVGPFTGFMCVVLAVKWSRHAKARVAIQAGGREFEIDSMPLAFVRKA